MLPSRLALPTGARAIDWAFVVIVVVASVVFTLLAGKDLNYDQLNYHFYLAHSLLHDRLQEDFAAANGQSFLNPLAYVPFYWMVKHGWHSVLIASLLAAFHALNIVIAYFITKTVLPEESSRSRWFAVLGGVLTLLTPVYLNEVGTTFADVSTSVFVLGAVLCALKSQPLQSWWRDLSLCAGIAMGIAGGLKLSNFVFGPACALLLVLVHTGWWTRLRSLLLLALGTVAGFVIAHGIWGVQLWDATGNPFFPWFSQYFPANGIFPPEGAMLERFLAKDAWDALTLPFRMILLQSWIYIETLSPDLRLAALVLFAIVGVGVRIASRRNPIALWKSNRKALAFTAYVLVAYALWQWTSGNGRYGLVVLVLCGPMLAIAARAAFPSEKAGLIALVVLSGLHAFHLQHASLRWSSGPWTASWYDVRVPERLQREPFLYVSVGNNSNSFVYPFLAEGSAFTNPIGQTPFELDGAGGKYLRALFAEYRGRIRILGSAPRGDDVAFVPGWAERMDNRIARLDLGVDATDCEMIDSLGPPDVGQDVDADKPYRRRLLSCRLVERSFELAEERRRMTKIAREVAEWCPKLFKPAYSVLERSSNMWIASYPSTDSTIIFAGGAIIGSFTRASRDIVIAQLDDWARGIRPACSDMPDLPREAHRFE